MYYQDVEGKQYEFHSGDKLVVDEVLTNEGIEKVYLVKTHVNGLDIKISKKVYDALSSNLGKI